MDIEVVRAKKRSVERRISNLITEFHKETGVGVAGISIDILPARMNERGEETVYSAELDVWL